MKSPLIARFTRPRDAFFLAPSERHGPVNVDVRRLSLSDGANEGVDTLTLSSNSSIRYY